MARSSAVSPENSFIKGLITEATGLNFPENACTETFDCVFDQTGTVSRRLGFDYETSATTASITRNDSAIIEYVWDSVAGNGNKQLVVVQIGNILHFYDVGNDTNLSTRKKSFTVDLDTYKITGVTTVAAEQCQFATGAGRLFVVNRFITPIYITWNSDDTITVSTISIKIRDFKGIIETTEVDFRPSTLTGIHKYNLFNQGWYPDGITSDNFGSSGQNPVWMWDAGRTDFPSNADVWWVFKDSSENFNRNNIGKVSLGTTPAPKGHYVLDAFNQRRAKAVLASVNVDTVNSRITYSCTLPHAFIAGQALTFENNNLGLFDFINFTPSSISADTELRIDFTSPIQLRTITAVNTTTEILTLSSACNLAVADPITVTSTGSVPGGLTSGTTYYVIPVTSTTIKLATSSANAIANTAINITSAGSGTIRLNANPVAGTYTFSNTDVYPNDLETTTAGSERPTVTSFFAGRIFYGGVNTSGYNNNIYFSRVIESELDYGYCMQINDPTAEDNSDLYPTDGGVIVIPEMGNLIRMMPVGSDLILFASNGIWQLSGSKGLSFAANDYAVRKLSSVPAISGTSFVTVEGFPMFWNNDGIYIARANQVGDLQVDSLTNTTIATFYASIPTNSKYYAKGVYDANEKVVSWLYRSTAANDIDIQYTYDRVLNFNILTTAFYPWTIQQDELAPNINGSVIIQYAGVYTPSLKYLTTTPVSGTTFNATWSVTRDTSYRDWVTPGRNLNYVSFATTGYKVHSQGVSNYQKNYVVVYCKRDADSSLNLRGRWDFANNAASGIWSTSQEVYVDTQYREFVMRRIKIRGQGKSCQLAFTSTNGKPFFLIGWAAVESSNQGP
jgi:hypothetical protein